MKIGHTSRFHINNLITFVVSDDNGGAAVVQNDCRALRKTSTNQNLLHGLQDDVINDGDVEAHEGSVSERPCSRGKYDIPHPHDVTSNCMCMYVYEWSL